MPFEHDASREALDRYLESLVPTYTRIDIRGCATSWEPPWEALEFMELVKPSAECGDKRGSSFLTKTPSTPDKT
jgi:hypothetical protein